MSRYVTLAALCACAAGIGVAAPAHSAAPTRTFVQQGDALRAPSARIDVRGRRITRVRVVVKRYVCEEVGDLAPHVVDLITAAPVSADGHFSVRESNQTEVLTLRGRVGATRLSARLRVKGTVGTGDRCDSGEVAVRAQRRSSPR